MALMALVWGVHYIVVKDALSDLAPLTFNAIRFSIGLPVILLAGMQRPAALRVARRDIPRLVLLGLIGPFGYQMFFILGLERTTSTNTALLTATMPTWTALLTIVLGIIVIRRQMLVGVALSLVGVALVVVGQSEGGISLSRADAVGSSLALAAAMVTAVYNISIKPLVDRYGGTVIAFWTYCLTTVGLIAASLPDLATLGGDSLTARVVPNLLYSGILSCAFGFLTENFALHRLGPARTATYYNFTPIIAAFAGVAALGDPLTVGLVMGGALTLWGVTVVRRNTFLRLPASQPQPEVRPAVEGRSS